MVPILPGAFAPPIGTVKQDKLGSQIGKDPMCNGRIHRISIDPSHFSKLPDFQNVSRAFIMPAVDERPAG